MLICTSSSTILGAYKQPNWIPVAMGIASALGAASAYLQLDERLRRVNGALVSIRKLMVWWHGLSVIEKRIPANKSNMVLTMETIIMTETGHTVISNTRENDSTGATDDAEGGK